MIKLPFFSPPDQPQPVEQQPVIVPHWLFELVKEAAQPEEDEKQ